MNYLDYLPGIGSVRFAERAGDRTIPFEERLYDAVRSGTVSAGHFIVMSELGFHSHAMIRAAQATVAAAPAALVATPVVVASVISAATYDRTVNESIRRTHGRTPYYGPFAGAFGPVV